MAILLDRLGRMAFRWRWLVAAFWVAVLACVGYAATQAPKAAGDGFTMPGIESQKAFDLMEQRFPGADAQSATARVVFVARDGQQLTSAADRAVIEKLVAEAGAGTQVATVADPFRTGAVSQDQATAFATVTFTARAADLTGASKQHLSDAIGRARSSGLTVEVGGDALATQPAAGGPAEGIGIAVAALVLLVTFGSLVAAGLPLLTAVLGVGIGMSGILALGHALGLSETTGTLATMLGLACGIDYALFVVSRYREERGKGRQAREAAGLAAGTAGSAVVFAGLTVIIALAGLSVVGIPMLTRMGLAAAGAVAIAVLICLTLVPALLGFWPDAVLSRKARRGVAAGQHERRGEGNRWARLVLRFPLPVLLAGVAGLAALAVPVIHLQLGMPGDEAKSTSTTERRAYDALAEGFGPGFNGPLVIVVDARGAADPKTAVGTISKAVAATPGVVSVSPARFNTAGDTAIFSAIPATSPTDEKTKDLVQAIRDERPGVAARAGATFEVTGSTAVNIDVAGKVQGALFPYLAVVVGLAILLLLIVFRSILVPVKAAFGFLLSVLAALGTVVTVFQEGHLAKLLGVEQTGPIMSLMPIFLVGIVFGLAMDYEVFLVSRIREDYVRNGGARPAIVSGFGHSARVVTAAALIMTAVFSGFITADVSMIKMIGFGLAIAVLFDAFVVRMAIVPAVLALLGDRAWYLPRRLDRLLPRLDIEGERLHHVRPAPPAAPEPEPELARS
ncbi:MMPL family transporter [Actinoplanes subtropicus]|uniref:MMPL family transporter n=1 Tax=Actinoplanes subtropicus TaxID=543632 RepID=UPI0005561043|nr:MMPL family transporter [Actinoplanes subtropicus]